MPLLRWRADKVHISSNYAPPLVLSNLRDEHALPSLCSMPSPVSPRTARGRSWSGAGPCSRDTSAKRRIAILGGGVAGLGAAWGLSEAGWRDQASSPSPSTSAAGNSAARCLQRRGPGPDRGTRPAYLARQLRERLRMLRDCYTEINRATTDRDAPIRSWDQALRPADTIGLAEQWEHDWLVWLDGSPTTTKRREIPPARVAK